MADDNRAEEIKALARDHAELAIATLAEVAGDPGAKEAARVKAADVLLQRGFGAPERRAHLEALQALGRRKALPAPPTAPVEDAEWEDVTPKRK